MGSDPESQATPAAHEAQGLLSDHEVRELEARLDRAIRERQRVLERLLRPEALARLAALERLFDLEFLCGRSHPEVQSAREALGLPSQ